MHETVDSTNTWASRAIRDNELKLPALIAAQDQTAGRGQREKPWRSDKGSLTFSIAIPSQGQEPLLGLATAFAVAKGIQDLTHSQSVDRRVEIKWPNDLVMGGKKLGGILIERITSSRENQISSTWVIGIGLNINNTPPQLDAQAIVKATSLAVECSQKFSLATALHLVAGYVINNANRLTNNQPSDRQAIIESCRNRFWLLAKQVTLETAGKTFEGRCIGFAETGELVLQVGTERKLFATGKVTDVCEA